MRYTSPIILLLLLVSGCASRHGTSESQVLPTASSYLRVGGTHSQGRELQIALRRFSPREGPGPTIWLVGVSHIGDPAYYRKLQELLDTNRVVLYEGVGMKSARGSSASLANAHDPLRREALEQSLQGTLARSLGLVFQLTAIDYTRPHFQNSDLSRRDLEHLIAGSGSDDPPAQGSGGEDSADEAEQQFALLMQALDEGSWLNSIAKLLLGFIESSPQMRGIARLAMIELLGGMGGDLEALAKANPGMEDLLKVLVEARNAKVMEDVARLLQRKRSRATIAIFYGAAHMKDFEARLSRQFNYVPREEQWLTAFAVDFQQSGIGTAEQAMIRSMIQWQLESLQSKD